MVLLLWFTLTLILSIWLMLCVPKRSKIVLESFKPLTGTISLVSNKTLSERLTTPNRGTLYYQVEVTGYCSCRKCCGKDNGITASGKVADEGTIAAPKSIKLYSTIYINMHKYTVLDRGGAIRIKNGLYRFDLWFPSHKEALAFGRKKGIMYKRGDTYYIELEVQHVNLP